MERDLDVVVYGATGFVGKLTAEYLATAAPAGTRLALGGRNEAKLADLKQELNVDWPLVVADADDAQALRAMAERTRVVATTAGPYQQYGIKLVEACAEAGTHYADLTGEVLFMRETIDRFDARARETGARIVHTAGFDSIPSDLGVLMLHEAAGELEDTTFILRRVRGGLSGGTIASLRGQLDAVRENPSLRKVAGDPYALSPDRAAEPSLGDERDLMTVKRDSEFGWIAPFMMAGINTRVVRRSNALQDFAYGRRFRYREVMSAGGDTLAPVRGGAIVAGLGGLVAGLSFGPTRTLLDHVLPAPGSGPSEKTRRTGYYAIEIHGGGHVAHVAAKGDPGYAATAVLFGESALCLALHELGTPAGVLTPASAMGMSLVERLRRAGHTFEVVPAAR
jgi:short subunit dehydrogenase-like uncharacterized protein